MLTPEAGLQSDSDPLTPPQRKRTLDDELYIPATTSGAQKEAKGKSPKKRKMASSLPFYVKQNVVREVATVRTAPVDGRPRCVVSGASDQRMVIEFSHVLSGSTSLDDVSVIFFCG